MSNQNSKKLSWKNEGYTFQLKIVAPSRFSEWLDHPEDCDQQILQVNCYDKNGVQVGQAHFGYLTKDRGGHLSGLEVSVHSSHQRKGLASAMYDLAEEHYFDEIKPYPGHSIDASKFWKNRQEKNK